MPQKKDLRSMSCAKSCSNVVYELRKMLCSKFDTVPTHAKMLSSILAVIKRWISKYMFQDLSVEYRYLKEVH